LFYFVAEGKELSEENKKNDKAYGLTVSVLFSVI